MNNLTIPILGTLPWWMVVPAIIAVFLIARFALRLVIRLVIISGLIALYILLGHAGLFNLSKERRAVTTKNSTTNQTKYQPTTKTTKQIEPTERKYLPCPEL